MNPFDSTVLLNVPVRPLNKGMFQNLPSNGIPDGGFWRVQNYRVKTQGLARRGGFIDYDTNISTGVDQYNEQIFDIIYFYQRSGLPEMLLLTSEKLYRMDGLGKNTAIEYTPVTETVISNTATVVDTFTVTIAGTVEESDRIRPGDIAVIDGTDYVIRSSTFSSPNIVITIEGSGVTLDEFATDSFLIKERFLSRAGLGPQYAVLPSVGPSTDDKVVICDQGERGLYQYTTGGGLEPFEIDSTDGIGGTTNYLVGAKSITYFDDRLWFANTEEVDGIYNQRIRWTDPTNFDRVAPASYTDLPYSQGQILRLVPLGALLVAYFEDAIYLGRRTNMAGQPYFFEKLETGKDGLLAARAIVSHIDTHYFVGKRNIYSLSGSTGFQLLGEPILEEALFYTRELRLDKYTQVEHDPGTKSIVFFFPDKKEASLEKYPALTTRLWRFYYETNAWAYDEISYGNEDKTAYNYIFTGLMPSKKYIAGTWDDWYNLTGSDIVPYNASWTGEADPDAPNYPTEPDSSFAAMNTWYALFGEDESEATLKIAVWSAPLSRQLIVEEFEQADADQIGGSEYPIWALLESGDADFNMPDYTKTVTRLSVKAMHIYSERESSLVSVGGEFTLEISDAMGYHWKRPITLRFKRNYNEGYANFRSTGSTFRFKLINSQVIAPYVLSEYIMRSIGRGLQVEN